MFERCRIVKVKVVTALPDFTIQWVDAFQGTP
jgi:hypothetical protein